LTGKKKSIIIYENVSIKESVMEVKNKGNDSNRESKNVFLFFSMTDNKKRGDCNA